VGLEEEAVMYLLQKASPEHQIRSAFTRGSVRGYIYVESIMDANMISLLNITPGIIRTLKHFGVVRQKIDPSDWVKLLTMQDPLTVVKASQWIRVRSGVYKGDIGFLTRVEAWGARVLVVPRLKTPLATPQPTASLKRKRTLPKPEPRLFDPASFSSMFQRQPRLLRDGTYTSRGLFFDHGLLCLNLDLHSICINSTGVPSDILGLFRLSSHPSLIRSNFPRPEEWIFEEGERVTVLSSGKEATIAAVKSTHLEVDLATSEGIEDVSWFNVHKVFSTGAFVRVSATSGPLRGTMGWVERIADDTVYFLEYKEKGNLSKSNDNIKVSFILTPADVLIFSFILQQYDCHVNWLKLTAVPFLHASSTSNANDSLSKADRVPWIGTRVLIAKVGNPLKGYYGDVKDVLPGQNTNSGLKISLQLTHLNSSSPFKPMVVDYDDVVEAESVKDLHLQESIHQVNMPSSRTKISLFDYAQPQSVLFHPSQDYLRSVRRRHDFGLSPQAPMPGVSNTGGATPMPEQTSSLTPAWDPSSRTPR